MVRNPYPFPRIGDKILLLEGFQYDTWLDINTKFYTIDISSKSCNITSIVTEFGKLRYNGVPLGLCDYGDIIQDKVDKLLGYI